MALGKIERSLRNTVRNSNGVIQTATYMGINLIFREFCTPSIQQSAII
jgi:hypothetical protein